MNIYTKILFNILGTNTTGNKTGIKPEAVKNTTVLILVISIISLIGHTPSAVAAIIFTYELMTPSNYTIYIIFGNTMISLSRTINLFAFLFFNKSFKRKFLEFFCRKKYIPNTTEATRKSQ